MPVPETSATAALAENSDSEASGRGSTKHAGSVRESHEVSHAGMLETMYMYIYICVYIYRGYRFKLHTYMRKVMSLYIYICICFYI